MQPIFQVRQETKRRNSLSKEAECEEDPKRRTSEIETIKLSREDAPEEVKKDEAETTNSKKAPPLGSGEINWNTFAMIKLKGKEVKEKKEKQRRNQEELIDLMLCESSLPLAPPSSRLEQLPYFAPPGRLTTQ